VNGKTPLPSIPAYLVSVRPDPAGTFTAQLLGLSELSSTAATREEAVEQVRALIRQQLDAGTLVSVEASTDNPVMSFFGHAKDDPDFEGYLEEIRKFREEMDRHENYDPGSGTCSDTS
jgi:hypothetical protein